MLKGRAIFLKSVATLLETNIVYDENFQEILNSFYESYKDVYFKQFNLIFYFKLEGDEPVICEDEKWHKLLYTYLDYFTENNTSQILKIYNDVGYKDTEEISKLAELFYDYFMQIMSYHYSHTLKS